MKMKDSERLIKVNFTPKQSIQDYLSDEFALKLFDIVVEYSLAEWGLSPLNYFNLVYEQIGIVIANKEKPLNLISHLMGLKLPEEQILLVLLGVVFLIEDDPTYKLKIDNQLKVCLNLIKRETHQLNKKFVPENIELFEKFNFDFVFKKIKEFKDNRRMLGYLTNTLFDYRNINNFGLEFTDLFIQNCKSEIERIKALEDIENSAELPKSKIVKKNLKGKKNFTTVQIRIACFLLDYKFDIPTGEMMLKKYSKNTSIDKFLQNRITSISSLSRLSENIRTDNINKKNLEQAKQLILMEKSKKAHGEINQVISSFMISYNQFYNK